MTYEGYKDKKGRKDYLKKYMRDRRAQQKEKVEQDHAKIEEMTFNSFDDVQYSWCVEDRMAAGDSEEGAKAYCDVSREKARHLFATDLEEKAKAESLVESAIEAVDSEVKAHFEEVAVDAALLDSCVKVRVDNFREDSETATAFCREILGDPLFCDLWRKQLDAEKTRESTISTYMAMYSESEQDATRRFEKSSFASKTDVFTEFGERVYVIQKLYGVSEEHAKRYVTTDMMREGKFADVTKRTYNRVSVGDLYGKTKAQRIAESYPEQTHYGKDATAREEFQRVEDEQRGKGVRLPGDPTPLPKGGRATVGNLYGKTRKEIRDMGGDP